MRQQEREEFAAVLNDLCIAVDRRFDADMLRVFCEDLMLVPLWIIIDRAKQIRSSGKSDFSSKDLGAGTPLADLLLGDANEFFLLDDFDQTSHQKARDVCFTVVTHLRDMKDRATNGLIVSKSSYGMITDRDLHQIDILIDVISLVFERMDMARDQLIEIIKNTSVRSVAHQNDRAELEFYRNAVAWIMKRAPDARSGDIDPPDWHRVAKRLDGGEDMTG